MKSFFKKFLSVLFLCITIPSLHLSANCVNGNKDLVSSQSLEITKKNSKFELDKSNLLDCISLLYMDKLETERLILDEEYFSDVRPLANMINNKEIYKYLYYGSDCKSINENFSFASDRQAIMYVTYPFLNCTRAYFEFIKSLKDEPNAKKLRENAIFKSDRFVIRKKDTKEPMGWIGFDIKKIGEGISIEIDYFLGKIYQKQGYAQEGAIALSKKIFGSINEGIFIVNHHKLNEDSKKLANKILNSLMEDKTHSYKLTTLDINNMTRYNLEKTIKK